MILEIFKNLEIFKKNQYHNLRHRILINKNEEFHVRSTHDNFTTFEMFKNLRKTNVTVYAIKNKEFNVFKSTYDNFDFTIFEMFKNLEKKN